MSLNYECSTTLALSYKFDRSFSLNIHPAGSHNGHLKEAAASNAAKS